MISTAVVMLVVEVEARADMTVAGDDEEIGGGDDEKYCRLLLRSATNPSAIHNSSSPLIQSADNTF